MAAALTVSGDSPEGTAVQVCVQPGVNRRIGLLCKPPEQALDEHHGMCLNFVTVWSRLFPGADLHQTYRVQQGGSSSSISVFRWDGSRVRPSVRYANGSWPFSLADCSKLTSRMQPTLRSVLPASTTAFPGALAPCYCAQSRSVLTAVKLPANASGSMVRPAIYTQSSIPRTTDRSHPHDLLRMMR